MRPRLLWRRSLRVCIRLALRAVTRPLHPRDHPLHRQPRHLRRRQGQDLPAKRPPPVEHGNKNPKECAMKTFLPFLFFAIAPAFAATCDSLSSLALPDTTVTMAQSVAPGEFTPPSGRAGSPAASVFKKLPAFCRVAATLKPTTDSDIKIEVWLPASGWNGKFQAVGNGGWSGAIGYSAMG